MDLGQDIRRLGHDEAGGQEVSGSPLLRVLPQGAKRGRRHLRRQHRELAGTSASIGVERTWWHCSPSLSLVDVSDLKMRCSVWLFRCQLLGRGHRQDRSCEEVVGGSPRPAPGRHAAQRPRLPRLRHRVE